MWCPAGLHDWRACLCRAGTFLALPIGGGLAQGASMAAEDALVLAHELAAAPSTSEALARYAVRRTPRTRHVQETTAMRSRLAALALQDRAALIIPAWAELSARSFAALLPDP